MNPTCVICDAPLTGRRTVVCSDQCRRKRLTSSEAFAAARARHRAKTGGTSTRSPSKRCAHCGKPGVRYDATYCSQDCGGIARRRPPKPKPPKPPRPLRDGPSRRVYISNCQMCERLFASPSRVVTCSPECQDAKRRHDRRRSRLDRRARQKAAFVASVYPKRIYKRDDWTCQLCGKPIDREAVAPAPLAPTIDHVIPLNRGGTHEPGNVQAAHFICNSRKGDRLTA